MEKTVMLVEDEISLAKILAYDLKKNGYEVTIFHDGELAAQAIAHQFFTFYILDWMLPHRSGIDLIPLIRTHQPTGYIVMVTAKEDELSVVEGLEAGADHYMSKPISHRELIAHLNAFIRRHEQAQPITSTSRPAVTTLLIDVDTRKAVFDQHELALTKIEFELLHLFHTHPQRVFTRDYLLNTIWGFNYDGSSRIVDVHISNLRLKLPPNAGELISIRGVGYRWEPAS